MSFDPDARRTLTSLRARREAHRMAREMLHPPMEPYQFYCRQCGARLDSETLDLQDHIRCAECGLRTRLPSAAAADVRRFLSRRRRPLRCQTFSDQMGTCALWAYLLLAVMLIFAVL